MEQKVMLERECNDFFRVWILKEWDEHNLVDTIYQLKIIEPKDLKFKENEEYYKIIFEGRMVGFVGIMREEKEVYLFRLYIEKEYRNIGIGTYVLNKIIDIAKKEDKDLTLEVLGENIAKHLYERMGFKTHYTRMVLKISDDIYGNIG